jgi:phage gp36-like protein
MADYCTLDQLRGEIPEPFLTHSLDDDGDGVVDAWDKVRSNVQTFIDGVLSTRYPVPFTSSVPHIVKSATLTLCAEACYKRRKVPDESNPHHTAASGMRKILEKIAEGKIQLQVSTPRVEEVDDSGEAITFPGALGSPGRLLA